MSAAAGKYTSEEIEQFYEILLAGAGLHHVKGIEYRSRCIRFSHDGGNPNSLWVNMETGGFCCFACGVKGGGIYSFAQEVLRLQSTSGQAPEHGAVVQWIHETLGTPFTQRVYPEDLRRKTSGIGWDRTKAQARYVFTDELGQELYSAWRFVDAQGNKKTPPDHPCPCSRDPNAQCEPRCENGRVWGMKGIPRVLYHLIDVLQSLLIFVVEGEKNADDLSRALALYISQHGGFRLGKLILDRVAVTTNVSGADGWKSEHEYGKVFASKIVIKLGDKNESGRKHDAAVCRDVCRYAAQLFTCELPVGDDEDISDFLKQRGQHGIEDLIQLLATDRKLYAAPVVAPAGEAFNLLSIGELLARPEVPPDYLVDGIHVCGTVSAAVAKPKVGKSTYARNLCIAVARGIPFLGRETKQGECIYLALEERVEEVTADFRAMGAEASDPIEVHAAAAPAQAIAALADLIRRKHPALVVIDPMIRFVHIRDEKAYAETYAALGPVIDIARETGTHIHLTHHSSKLPKTDPIDSPIGSTAIGGAVATLIVLAKRESYRTITTVTRIGTPLPETVLQFDIQTKLLSVGGTREEADCQQVEDEIVEYFKGLPEGEEREEPEILDHAEGTTKNKRKALRSLVEKKKVLRSGGGKKGDPYKYSFARFEGIPKTSKRESEKVAQPPVVIEEKLVLEKQQNLWEREQGKTDREQAFSESGKSAPLRLNGKAKEASGDDRNGQHVSNPANRKAEEQPVQADDEDAEYI